MKKEDIVLKHLRLIRTLKGIKEETMAKLLGISQGEYSKIENKHRKNYDKHIDKILNVLEMDEDLLQELVENYTQK